MGIDFLIPANESGTTPHLWIILTDPNPACVLVSVSTLRYGKDQTVVLMPDDHPFVRHQSMIMYSDSMIVELSVLEAHVQTGIAVPRESCPPQILKLIQDGVLASPFTPRTIQDFFRAWKRSRSNR